MNPRSDVNHTVLQSIERERENEWLKREAAIGSAQLEAGQTVRVRSKKEFLAMARGTE